MVDFPQVKTSEEVTSSPTKQIIGVVEYVDLPLVEKEQVVSLTTTTESAPRSNTTSTADFSNFKIPKNSVSGPVFRSDKTSEGAKFDELIMAPLLAYDIPLNIWQAEQNNDKYALDCLKKMTEKAREDQEAYLKAATTMLHLEEAEKTEEPRSFDFIASNKEIKIVSNKSSKIKIGIVVKD